MSTLFPQKHTVIRRQGEYNKGVWRSHSTTLNFMGSIQPVSGREIDALPIARKDIGTVKIYSSTPLCIAEEGKENTGDIVLFCGRQWEVVQRLDYTNGLIPHLKYIGQDRGAI